MLNEINNIEVCILYVGSVFFELRQCIIVRLLQMTWVKTLVINVFTFKYQPKAHIKYINFQIYRQSTLKPIHLNELIMLYLQL